MRKFITLAVCCCLAIFTTHSQTINATNAFVSFKVSNMGFNTVKGTFKDMKGTLDFDVNDLGFSKIEACIDASTVNTNNKKRDQHLREADFFDTDTFPSICFVSTTIEKTSKAYVAKGKLTMRGVTKDIEIPFTFSNNTFKGTLKLKRLDYKVGEDTGTFMVGNTIAILIETHLN